MKGFSGVWPLALGGEGKGFLGGFLGFGVGGVR